MIFFLYFLIYAMPLKRDPLWPSYVEETTVMKYLGGAACLAALVYLPSRSRPPAFFKAAQSSWYLGFVAWALLSCWTFGGDPTGALNPMLSYVSFTVLLFVVLVFVDSEVHLRRVLLVAVGSVGYASLHILREWQKYGHFSASYRPGWVVGDPNYYTASVLLCMPLAYYLAREAKRPWEKWFLLGCLVLGLFGMTVAASRGGLLGLCAAVLIIAWRSPRRGRFIGIVSILLVPLLLLTPSSPVRRLFTPDASDEQASENRLAVWRAGLGMLLAHPLTGVGVGRFRANAVAYGATDEPEVQSIAHNTYVNVAAEMGLPGIGLFLGMIGTTQLGLIRLRRQARVVEARLVRTACQGVEVGLWSFLVAALFLSCEYLKLFWLMVFISMSLPPLVRTAPLRARRKEARESGGLEMRGTR